MQHPIDHVYIHTYVSTLEKELLPIFNDITNESDYLNTTEEILVN